jgi:hypothetical protein
MSAVGGSMVSPSVTSTLRQASVSAEALMAVRATSRVMQAPFIVLRCDSYSSFFVTTR